MRKYNHGLKAGGNESKTGRGNGILPEAFDTRFLAFSGNNQPFTGWIRFFAVFGGMTGLVLGSFETVPNPNGIAAISLGLRGTSYPR